MVYGARRVTGQIAAWEYDNTNKVLSIGVIFAYGEQASITLAATYINGEPLTTADIVSDAGVHVGDGSTAIDTILTGMTAWVAADTTLWQDYCHAAIEIDCRAGQIPSSLTVEANLGGRMVDASYRSGSASTASTNPVDVGYDIMTSSDWRGLAAAKIETNSWSDVADWCEEQLSAADRYEFQGILSERDPDAALAIVLDHALASPYIDGDGKVRLWCEMPPVAITGDWSASASTTVTEDATSGAATSQLTVGDRVYVGTNLRQVVTVPDDDTFTVDSAVTVSGVKVRPTSNVYIRNHHWAAPPAATNSS